MSDSAVSGPLGRLTRPLYFVAFLLVVFPLVDFGLNVWPLRFAEVSWRYGTVGLLAQFLLTPLLGLAIAWAIAELNDDRGIRLFLTVTCALAAVVLVVSLLEFVLDVLQMSATVAPERVSTFQVGAIRSVLKQSLTILALIWLAIAGWRTERARRGGRHRRSDTAPLVAAKRAPKGS